MADRTISYSFRGNFTNLTAGLTAASRGVQDLGGRFTALDRDGARMRAGLTSVGNTAGKIGLGAAAGLGLAVKAAADFDQAMSNVQAATHETAANMDLLRAAALKAGADTAYSATEAAGAIEALSKAGVSTADVLAGGLTGALDLAAAGTLDVSEAAEIAATTLTQFGLAGDQTGHVADVLAAAAGKAQGEVTDMAGALKYVGPVAAQMGVSLEETSGAIAELASQGIIGEAAGTGLRGMLTSLTSPSKAAATEMSKLGINLYDAQGKFVGIDGIAGQLKTTMSGLSDSQRDVALGTIFGNEQITAARILYAGGAEAVQDWTTKVNDSGYAAETAATKMDNLKGDLEQLGGSLETLLIGSGSGSQGFLRGLVQDTTSAINALNKMPDSAKNATAGLLAITAVTGGGLFLGSRVISSIADTRLALANLGTTGTRAGAALKGLGIAGGVAAGLFALGAAAEAIEQKFDNALPSTDALTKSILDLGSAQAAQRLADEVGSLSGALDTLDSSGLQGLRDNLDETANAGGLLGTTLRGISLAGAGVGLGGLVDPVNAKQLREAADAIGAVDDALANIATTGGPDQARQAFADLAAAQGLSAAEQKALLASLPEYSDALDAASNSADLAAGATGSLGAATGDMGSISDQVADDVDKLADAMRKQYDAAVGAFDAVTQYREALKAASKQARESDAGIRGNSEAALKNRDSLSALAGAWNNQSDAVKNTRGSFAAARGAFIDTAKAMGVPEAAAKRLAAELLSIPPKRLTKVTVDPGNSQAVINGLKYDLSNLKDKTVYINTINRRSGAGGQGPATTLKAAGGPVNAPGGPVQELPTHLQGVPA